MSSNDKIEVEWLDPGRSLGKRSWIRKMDVRKGDIIVGRTITVTWGKSKKLYTCKVIRTNSISSPEIPTQREARSSKRRDESIEPLLYEIGSPAPHHDPEETIARYCVQETREDKLDEILKILREGGLSEFKQRMDDLLDCISGMNAKIKMLEMTIRSANLQEPTTNDRVTVTGPLTSTFLQPEAESMILREIENLPSSEPRVLRDVGNLPSQNQEGKFTIAQSIVNRAMSGCRSRRNLAGRLTQILFTEEEKIASNVRGVGGKQPLNELKVDAIREVCYQQFPLDRTEPKMNADKDVRNSMDEVCRKMRGKQS